MKDIGGKKGYINTCLHRLDELQPTATLAETCINMCGRNIGGVQVLKTKCVKSKDHLFNIKL